MIINHNQPHNLSLFSLPHSQHMHHGFYPKNGPMPSSNQQAQIDMIEQSLSTSNVTTATSMVDVGCGIGGSSRYIARKYGCSAKGITLSPKQAKRATEITEKAGMGGKVSFQVADALSQPFDDQSFDLVWSMESGEVRGSFATSSLPSSSSITIVT